MAVFIIMIISIIITGTDIWVVGSTTILGILDCKP